MKHTSRRTVRPRPKRHVKSYTKSLASLLFTVLFGLFFYFFQHAEVHLPDPHATVTIASTDVSDNIKLTILEAIKNARKSITILIYSIHDPSIISALKSKAEQGIDVQVLYDPVASKDAALHLGPKIKALPVRSSRGLMHLKLISIDSEQAWIGSCNMTTDSLVLHGNLLAGFYSKAMAQVIEEKALQLQKLKPKNVEPKIITSESQSYEIYFSPEQGSIAEKRIQSLISSAQKTIRVAAYTFTNFKLAQSLVDAKSRGVDVQVIFDKESSKNTSQKAYILLKRGNVPTGTRIRQGLMHHKMAIIDDTTLIMGSSNWTKAAFTINDEITCIISPLNVSQATSIKKTWEAMFDNSTLRNSLTGYSL